MRSDQIILSGLQDATDAVNMALQAIEHEAISNQARVLVDMCAYAGTGNVLHVQGLLHRCDEHLIKKDKDDDKDDKKEEAKEGEAEEPVKDDTFQGFAVLGIALVSMGEDVGSEMCMRQLSHLVCRSIRPGVVVLTFGTSDAIRRASHPESRTSRPRPAQRVKSTTTCA